MDDEYNRWYIKIQTILEINPKTIHEALTIALAPKALLCRTVVMWSRGCHQGRENVNDHPRSASPLSELHGENIKLVRDDINNDPYSVYDDISLLFNNRTNYPRLS